MNSDVQLSVPGLVAKCNVIVFDCDGVLLNSNQIKEDTFADLANYHFGPEAAQFIRTFHRNHGGLSRTIKFDAVTKIFTSIKPVTVEHLCHEFERQSSQMLLNCSAANELRSILDTLIERGKRLVVLSGTPENSLQELLSKRQLSHFFEKILGSPRSKIEYFKLLHNEGILNANEPFTFVGDSMTDLEAAEYFPNCHFFWSEEFGAAPATLLNSAKIKTLLELTSGQKS